MTLDQQHFLSVFKQKVLRLKSQYGEKLRENEALSEEIQELKRRNTLLEDELNQVRMEVSNLKMAGSVVSGSQELVELKETVDRMVREIDGCIALLND